MRILLINSVWEKGSTGAIIKNLFESFCCFGHETFVIFGRGKHVDKQNVFKKTFEIESKIHHFISLFTGNMYGGMFFSTLNIIRKIKRIKPDVVNLHCLNGYFVNVYLLLKWLAKKKYKTILTMHADFMMTGGCGIASTCNFLYTNECKKCPYVNKFNSKFSLNRTHYFYKKMQKAISDFEIKNLTITCVSPFLEKRYKKSNIYSRYPIYTILNPVGALSVAKNNLFETTNNILHVTSDINNPEKGYESLLKLANILPDYNFYVVSGIKCNFNVNHKNIHFIDNVNKNEIFQYYHSADLTLVLSLYETFSMVTAESLINGTCVAGFCAGGPESISIPEYSSFVPQNDLTALQKEIIRLMGSKFEKGKISEDAIKKYNPSNIAEQYCNIYKKLV